MEAYELDMIPDFIGGTGCHSRARAAMSIPTMKTEPVVRRTRSVCPVCLAPIPAALGPNRRGDMDGKALPGARLLPRPGLARKARLRHMGLRREGACTR